MLSDRSEVSVDVRLLALLPLLAACHGKSPADDTDTSGGDDTDTGTPQSWCEQNGFGLEVAWNDEGPFGEHRHELADNFSVDLTDGSIWELRQQWKGCESYIFIPDTIVNSTEDSTSIWARDVDQLVEDSPKNAHYFFVSRQHDEAAASSVADMSDRVDEVLATLDADDAAWWKDHLHVVAKPASDVGGWVESAFSHIGTDGFAIDRFQNVRGIGSFSDVSRYDPSLEGWPWESNLAYGAHEARFFNMEADRQQRLDGENATVVPMLTGEVVSQYAEADVELPSADEMATFDTFEIDVDMRCPDPKKPEFNNCGAWDYLAYLWVENDDGTWTELGRFITSYHRETHWVFDATPMMVHLLQGGTRHFKWEWAPEWNVQPTETRLSLRFSNQNKGYKPRQATFLFSGGGFGSTYNDGREPVDVDVPADAKKVELWTLVTGHGAGTNQCSEFCNHQHEFTVDGHVYLDEFPDAGNSDGCIAEIENQATPDQWGTWWLGRGGWCPGELVHPWSVDVTGDVTKGGKATISYRGLYDDDTPPDNSGDIVLSSWLVVYE